MGPAEIPRGRPPLYAIAGTIFDPSGALIPAANVALLKEDGTAIANTVADNRGSFRFDNVNSGKYRLLVEAVGFRDAKVEVAIGAESREKLRITMSLSTRTESVTVASDSAPVVNTEISGNQSSATLDRNALNRVPVFDQNYIAIIFTFSRQFRNRHEWSRFDRELSVAA